jgi:CubicO group peptidase (beta-lactamase class C family)
MSVEALRAYAEGTREALGFPGLAVAVTDREGLVASEAFGLANLDAGAPVTPRTSFELGSIGKTFTAVAVLQLHEEGRLHLHEPLTTYLPWFEVRSEHAPITLHHLLTHTSGLLVGAELSGSSRYDVWALRETETGFAPGARWLYSNVGYRALGFLVEDLTGMPYPQAVRRRILEPLGLEETDAEVTNEGRGRLAVGYARGLDDRPAGRDDPWQPAPWLETATGDGAITATMEDLAAFLRTLLNRGDGVLTEAAFELAAAPWIEADDGWSYGYGLEVRERDGRREIRHGGSMPGFGATMLGDLSSGLGVAVAVNAVDEHDLTEQVAEGILSLFRDDIRPAVIDPLATGDAVELAGLYVGDAGRLELVAEGGRLLLDGRERITLEPRGAGRFYTDRAGLSLFHLDFRRENGSVVEAVHGADVYRRDGVAGAPAPAPPPEWNAYTGHYRAYNPWYPNFRVVLRRGELVLIWAWGTELSLAQLEDGSFRGTDEQPSERVRFDAVVDGKALRATVSGEAYYRVP